MALPTKVLEARMQGCFGVPRFWASLRHSSKPSESTRPKPHTGSAEGKTQPQRCWQMPRQRGPKTSTRLFDIIDWSSWLGRREIGKALQTSTPCRLCCAAPWPGSVTSSDRGAAQRTQRPPWCSSSCGWAGARSLRVTSRPTTTPRSTSWPWRPKRWATGWTGHPFCGLTALHTGISPRARFSGKPSGHSSFLASWRDGRSGIGTCWSSWSREASGPRKGLRGSGARTTAAASCATMDQAPCSTAATNARPCRQKETSTSHRRCAWLHALWVRNAGSSLHTAFFLTLAPVFQQVFLNVPGFVAHSAPRRAAGGAHFHGRLFVGQRRVATGWLGCGGGRRCGKPQGGSVWSGTERHFARAVRSRWRRICSGHGEAHHLGSAHAAHRLRRYHRDNQRSKSTKPWEPEATEHTSGAGVCFPTTRSGLFRAVPKQTLSWLDWSTFVGLLRRGNYTGGAVGSCEAGLGRTVMGPTTPNKQRVAPHAAVLAHWERVGEFADSKNLAMQRFDQRRWKLWEASGLNDQLESRPVVFAPTRQTGLALQVGFCGLFSTAQARLRRYVCSGLRWVFPLRKRGRAL